MKRILTYHPPRVEEVIQTFPTTDRLETFLFRRLQKSPLPWLTLPYLVYGSTDHEAPLDRRVHVFAVVYRPRVTPVACVREEGFGTHACSSADSRRELGRGADDCASSAAGVSRVATETLANRAKPQRDGSLGF